jgi:hypothetical protein
MKSAEFGSQQAEKNQSNGLLLDLHNRLRRLGIGVGVIGAKVVLFG